MQRQAQAQLKTQKLREAEEAARAAGYGPVAIRLHFPDGVILQASFAATEPLSALRQLVARAVVPELAAAFQLFTTPPRTVLKDMDATFHKAQLVPAAHVYFSADGYSGPFLRPEVAAAVQQHVPAEAAAAMQARGGCGCGGSGGASSSGAAAAAAAGAGSNGDAGGASGSGSAGAPGGPTSYCFGDKSKAPKWMKIGK